MFVTKQNSRRELRAPGIMLDRSMSCYAACLVTIRMSGYAPPSHQNDEIEADDDDLVAISGDQLDKGKGRASLAPPSQTASRTTSPAAAGVSGKIGSNASGSSSGSGPRALRHEIGGIRVETRYTGVDSLDESVGDSLVSR